MTSGFVFSQRSLSKLAGVHPDLVRLATRALALSEVDFAVTEGVRDVQRQRQLVDQGASQTMNSMHLPRPAQINGETRAVAHAIDVAAYVGGRIRWDWPLYHRIKAAFDEASRELEIPFKWGGDWQSFPDGPHFELDRSYYPSMRGHPA